MVVVMVFSFMPREARAANDDYCFSNLNKSCCLIWDRYVNGVRTFEVICFYNMQRASGGGSNLGDTNYE